MLASIKALSLARADKEPLVTRHIWSTDTDRIKLVRAISLL